MCEKCSWENTEITTNKYLQWLLGLSWCCCNCEVPACHWDFAQSLSQLKLKRLSPTFNYIPVQYNSVYTLREVYGSVSCCRELGINYKGHRVGVALKYLLSCVTLGQITQGLCAQVNPAVKPSWKPDGAQRFKMLGRMMRDEKNNFRRRLSPVHCSQYWFQQS